MKVKREREQSSDSDSEYADKATPPKASRVAKGETPTGRKKREPRPKLQKWSDNDWLNVLLATVAACGRAGLAIPFGEVAKVVSPTCTASALQQALLKLHKKQRDLGANVPVLKMVWKTNNQSGNNHNNEKCSIVQLSDDDIGEEIYMASTHVATRDKGAQVLLTRLRAPRQEMPSDSIGESSRQAADDHTRVSRDSQIIAKKGVVIMWLGKPHWRPYEIDGVKNDVGYILPLSEDYRELATCFGGASEPSFAPTSSSSSSGAHDSTYSSAAPASSLEVQNPIYNNAAPASSLGFQDSVYNNAAPASSLGLQNSVYNATPASSLGFQNPIYNNAASSPRFGMVDLSIGNVPTDSKSPDASTAASIDMSVYSNVPGLMQDSFQLQASASSPSNTDLSASPMINNTASFANYPASTSLGQMAMMPQNMSAQMIGGTHDPLHGFNADLKAPSGILYPSVLRSHEQQLPAITDNKLNGDGTSTSPLSQHELLQGYRHQDFAPTPHVGHSSSGRIFDQRSQSVDTNFWPFPHQYVQQRTPENSRGPILPSVANNFPLGSETFGLFSDENAENLDPFGLATPSSVLPCSPVSLDTGNAPTNLDHAFVHGIAGNAQTNSDLTAKPDVLDEYCQFDTEDTDLEEDSAARGGRDTTSAFN